MRIHLLLLAVFFLVQTSFAQVQPPVSKNIGEFNLKGKVKSIMTFDIDAKWQNGQWTEISRRKIGLNKYDEKGNRIEWSFWASADGTPTTYTYVWEYDDSEKPLTVTEFSRFGPENISTFTYSKEGTTEESRKFDKAAITSISKYDVSGKIIYEENFGTYKSQTQYSYNQIGQLSEIRRINFDGEIYKTTYKYDSNDLILEKLDYENEQLKLRLSYKYDLDSQGNAITVITKGESDFVNGLPAFTDIDIIVNEIAYY